MDHCFFLIKLARQVSLEDIIYIYIYIQIFRLFGLTGSYLHDLPLRTNNTGPMVGPGWAADERGATFEVWPPHQVILTVRSRSKRR